MKKLRRRMTAVIVECNKPISEKEKLDYIEHIAATYDINRMAWLHIAIDGDTAELSVSAFPLEAEKIKRKEEYLT